MQKPFSFSLSNCVDLSWLGVFVERITISISSYSINSRYFKLLKEIMYNALLHLAFEIVSNLTFKSIL